MGPEQFMGMSIGFMAGTTLALLYHLRWVALLLNLAAIGLAVHSALELWG